MSKRYPGGVITKSPATPTGPYDTGAAPGIWTLDQQLQYQQQGVWPTAGLSPNYIEDVFSTYLYTGNGSTQTITNGIDLAGKGGLVWLKRRDASGGHTLYDTARGVEAMLYAQSTDSQYTSTPGVTAFNASGFSINNNNFVSNISAATYASWTFREQPKFFDVVTYTGTGSNRTIAHALGSVPGCIVVKRTDTTGAWQVYHRSLANTEYLVLNTTAATATGATRWNSTTPTSTVFSLGTDASVNASGGTYVAYIYAHDSGGFGLTGTDNVISCGSFTTDGSGNASVNLGYEPQFWLYKPTIAARYWTIYDTMRGWSQTEIRNLNPNVSDAEGGGAATAFYPTATGFDCVGGNLDASTQHIYIAIRRGPMKVPTDATKVFAPVTYSGNRTARTITTNFVTDLVITRCTTELFNGSGSNFINRLVGRTKFLEASSTSSEITDSDTITGLDNNTGYFLGTDTNAWGFNRTGENYVSWSLERAPSFFDVVCYTGTGANTTQTHNLAAVPELMIVKGRSNVNNWRVYSGFTGATKYLNLNSTDSQQTLASMWDSTAPTASVFTVGTNSGVNASGITYVAYLFATLAGVSKVGSYTGNGTTQTINCGFTAGARFVLIKRTDATGDWYTYDTARGMTTVTDPYSLMNSTTAETATLGSVTTVSTGFALNSAILAAINVSAGTYIFLAIA